jgi:glutathione S-transferase
MDAPILYSFRRCPYAMRARLALLVSETRVELREVKLRAKPDAMLAASPKGTVPVLVLPHGAVIDESLDVMHWALGRNDPEGWLTRDAPELIAINDGPFKHHLDRYKYPDRYDVDPLEHRARAADLLAPLESRLRAHANICDGRRGLTDMALLPFIRQFAETDRDYFEGLPLPKLQEWLARHLASPLFERIMLRVEPWKPGDAALYF